MNKKSLKVPFACSCNHSLSKTNFLGPICKVKSVKDMLESYFKHFNALQLQPNSASGSGALEHDPSSIYLRIPAGEAVPGPLPLGVSVIDASVALFGVVFPHVSYKHRCVLIKLIH